MAAPFPIKIGNFEVTVDLGELAEGWQQFREDVVEHAFFFVITSIAMTILAINSWNVARPISTWICLVISAESIVIEAAIVCEYDRIHAKVSQTIRRFFTFQNFKENYLKPFFRDLIKDLQIEYPSVSRVNREYTEIKEGLIQIRTFIGNFFRRNNS